jgi:hypothetical protein
MSAEVLGSVPARPRAPQAQSPASVLLLLEPSLVNRLAAVTVAVFAVPAVLALRAAAGASAPTTIALGGTLAAAALLALGFAALLQRAPRVVALRPSRVLCGALSVEVALLALGLCLRLVA